MPSPFPGMDPYLEGHLWPDVHNGLAFVVKEQLVPLLSPDYVVRTDIHVIKDTSPEEDFGIMYPDLEISKIHKGFQEPGEAYETRFSQATTPPTVSFSAVQNVEVRIPKVEIRESRNNRLITVIEILSPVNKRKPGLEPYREKRFQLFGAGVHLIEIDLIRRGKRPVSFPNVPKAHYWITLVRAGSGKTDIWALSIKDSLPVIPVPLKAPDNDQKLDLGIALRLLYERSAYQLSIDYLQDPPPPAFSDEDRAWMQNLLAAQVR